MRLDGIFQDGNHIGVVLMGASHCEMGAEAKFRGSDEMGKKLNLEGKHIDWGWSSGK